MKVILLVLFGIFAQPDATLKPSTMIATGQQGQAFASVDACEAAFVRIKAAAKKNADSVRALGHACVEITVEPIGTDI